MCVNAGGDGNDGQTIGAGCVNIGRRVANSKDGGVVVSCSADLGGATPGNKNVNAATASHATAPL